MSSLITVFENLEKHDSEHWGSCACHVSLFEMHEQIDAMGHKMQISNKFLF